VFGCVPSPVAGAQECRVVGIVVTLEVASLKGQTSAWESWTTSIKVHEGQGSWPPGAEGKRSRNEKFPDF
jgi:hypothetical protein